MQPWTMPRALYLSGHTQSLVRGLRERRFWCKGPRGVSPQQLGDTPVYPERPQLGNDIVRSETALKSCREPQNHLRSPVHSGLDLVAVIRESSRDAVRFSPFGSYSAR